MLSVLRRRLSRLAQLNLSLAQLNQNLLSCFVVNFHLFTPVPQFLDEGSILGCLMLISLVWCVIVVRVRLTLDVTTLFGCGAAPGNLVYPI